MHLPTYLFLMSSVFIYNMYEIVFLWKTNWLLFAASVFITIVTVAGAVMQSINADNFEFKWMLCYTIPLGLLVVSGLMQITEVSDSLMRMVGITPSTHIILGTSQDYKNAAIGHYISMALPFIAWLLSKFVQHVIDHLSRDKNA